jgi:glycosyltransferase involved in cell wall biosynthesis
MNNPPKKIAVITKYAYPVAAGIETNILETYAVLVEMGWDVTLYTSNGTLTEKNIINHDEVVRGVKIKRFPLKTFFFNLPIPYKEVDVVALHNFNLIPHFFVMIRTGIAKFFKQKTYTLILTPHGGFNPEWSVFPRLQAYIKIFLHYTMGVFIINRVVDGVRAVSNWEKAEMVKKGLTPDLVEVIDNGIEDQAYGDVEAQASDEIKQKVAALGTYIIQVGRIYPIKNYETTIQALPLIPSHIKFVIVGPVADNNYQKQLMQQAADLGVADRLVFFGVVRGSDKYYLIKKARMMVHMALWESFCNVVHEGLSQGLICLVADNTALPFLVKDGVNGFCLPTKDYKQLAEKISYVDAHMNDKEFIDMKARNREYGLENSWRKVAARMDEFYIARGK